MSIDNALGAAFMNDDLNSSEISAESSLFSFDAWDSQDIETVDKLTHENFIAWSHSGNKGYTKEEWMSWISPDFPKAEKLRIIFENDEIAVTHQFMSFKNGNEAVLCAWSIKDGKIIRCETGATPISS